MARTYKRDSRGRFAGGGGGGGGGGKSRPAPRQIQRGVNRLTRDNAGRITSVGGSGATARGGRIRTAAGNLRATVKASPGIANRMSSAPRGTVGKSRSARFSQHVDRPFDKRGAYKQRFTDQKATIASRRISAAAKPAPAVSTGARLGGTRRTMRAAAPRNTTPNRTGQAKTLNRFNSRPVGTKVLNAKNQLVASTTRVPLRVAGKGSNEADRAFGRVATKTARARAAAKPAAKPVTKATGQRKVDYDGGVKLLNQQKAAIQRLRSPQQTFGGDANYGRQVDIRTARSSPMQNAQSGIRAARGDYRRAQAQSRNQYALPAQRARAAASLPSLRRKVVKAVRAARSFKPEYAGETRRRYQAKLKGSSAR